MQAARRSPHACSDGLWDASGRRLPMSQVWATYPGSREAQRGQAVCKAPEARRPGRAFEQEQNRLRGWDTGSVDGALARGSLVDGQLETSRGGRVVH